MGVASVEGVSPPCAEGGALLELLTLQHVLAALHAGQHSLAAVLVEERVRALHVAALAPTAAEGSPSLAAGA